MNKPRIKSKLKNIIPKPIKSKLKKLGINKLLRSPSDKYSTALSFQVTWSKEFKKNKMKVLEYWERYRYLNEIKENCNINNKMKILDVGCGISTVLHFVQGEKFGIDPLADDYKKLYKFPDDINIQKGFGENIPFPNEYFDVIFCSNVLDHVTDPDKTVDEIYRVTKLNGYFVLTVEIFEKTIERDPAHPHCLSKDDVFSLLKNKFKPIYRNESPWIGLRAYVNGKTHSDRKEFIVIVKKNKR